MTKLNTQTTMEQQSSEGLPFKNTQARAKTPLLIRSKSERIPTRDSKLGKIFSGRHNSIRRNDNKEIQTSVIKARIIKNLK